MSASTDGLFRRTALVGLALTGLMLLGVAAYGPALPPAASASEDRELKFSHQNHVSERGMACADCHDSAPASAAAADRLIPGHPTCQTCHEEQVNNDCAYCHANPDAPGPVVLPARDVVFAHDRHVGELGVSCETCHGGVWSDSASADVHFPAMSTCVDCHTTHKASNECSTCHNDFSRLIPENHLASSFLKQHDNPVNVGMIEVDCATCHRESFCQECHSGDQLRRFGGMPGLMTAPGMRTPLRDSPDALRLQAAHDLNYRFNHSIDARSRASDCASCHEARTFCVECHRSEGVMMTGTVKPASHLEAGFVSFGSSAGGGRHAELGRRDIEACASCHDVDGKDPSCMLCHSAR